MKESLIRDQAFKEVSEVRLDTKNRVCLPKSVSPASTHLYRLYINASGQIILDPQVVIPAAEAWLYRNKRALASVLRGLKQAGEGKLNKLPSLSKHAYDEID